jgi:hypothetical protein
MPRQAILEFQIFPLLLGFTSSPTSNSEDQITIQHTETSEHQKQQRHEDDKVFSWGKIN